MPAGFRGRGLQIDSCTDDIASRIRVLSSTSVPGQWFGRFLAAEIQAIKPLSHASALRRFGSSPYLAVRPFCTIPLALDLPFSIKILFQLFFEHPANFEDYSTRERVSTTFRLPNVDREKGPNIERRMDLV